MLVVLLCVVIMVSAQAPEQEQAGTESCKGSGTPVLRRLPPLDAAKLDPNYGEDWKYEDFSDEKRGIFVHVVEKKQEKPPIGWSNSTEVVTELGTKWISVVMVSPERVSTLRIRLTADTIRYLITTPEAPLLPRYIALRDIYWVEGLPQSRRLEMIELASRDVHAMMRCMAVYKAGDYEPLRDVIPILCRALCDPSGEVAHAARGPLIRYFFPDDPKSVRRAMYTGFFSLEDLGRGWHSEALGDARRIHKIRPDLVTEEDLATIEALCEGLVKKPETKSDAQSPAKPQEQPDAKRPKAESK